MLAGALHEPLRELTATAVGIEAQGEAVVVDLADRPAGPLGVGASPDRHRAVTVDRERSVLRRVDPGLVATRRAGELALLAPGSDDRVAPANGLVIGVIAVLDVLAEQVPDLV